MSNAHETAYGQNSDNREELTQAIQNLHDSQTEPKASDNVDVDLYDQPKEPRTAIQRLIAQYAKDPARRAPITLRDYMARMQMIPRMAAQEQPENGFTMPSDLNHSTLRLVTGLISSRMQRASFQSKFDEPVSVVREMLLLCFEAKPRQISFAMSGYTASDFIAYIYQDVIINNMEISREDKSLPFIDLLEHMKTWLRIPPPNTIKNTPRRHIRRRIMATFNRTNHQASSLMEDREMPTEVLYLVQKLLERDDDQGYTRGDIRDFKEVRDDLNALADFVILNRFGKDSTQYEDLQLACCPSLVEDFGKHAIQRPRGRPAKKVSKKISSKTARKTATKSTEAKAAKKPGRKPNLPQTEVSQPQDDFGLEELKNLV